MSELYVVLTRVPAYDHPFIKTLTEVLAALVPCMPAPSQLTFPSLIAVTPDLIHHGFIPGVFPACSASVEGSVSEWHLTRERLHPDESLCNK